jgi:predicted phage terminase large subunit-like protein
MPNNQQIIKGARCELARRFFYDFCKAMAPDFYKPDRVYLKDLCNETQAFMESDDDILIVEGPPRHGKSRTVSLFSDWQFGKKPADKIMIGTYNETLSEIFSKNVRNLIDTEPMDENVIVYRDIFPKNKIKRGDGAVTRWSLEGQHASYLATSPTGTATGFGADLMIIDDLIKSALEANNADVLQKHWEWFTNTMLSRLEEGGKIIIIMTRWHSNDLAGRALKEFEGKKIRRLTFQALQPDKTMLCPEILSHESYIEKTRTMGADIASANYQQIPIDIKGKLYTSFKTYDELPKNTEGINAYCDTADEGADYLCNIIYALYNHEAYIIDVYYTKAPMETTEPETARRLTEHKVNLARVESNNGGRGYARAVEQQLEKLHNYFTTVKWFHQSKNKQARIITSSTWVMEHCYYPANWRDRWPEYYEAMTKYQKEGKNAHDDAPDATTGIAESMGKQDIGPVNVRL